MYETSACDNYALLILPIQRVSKCESAVPANFPSYAPTVFLFKGEEGWTVALQLEWLIDWFFIYYGICIFSNLQKKNLSIFITWLHFAYNILYLLFIYTVIKFIHFMHRWWVRRTEHLNQSKIHSNFINRRYTLADIWIKFTWIQSAKDAFCWI